MAWVMSAFIHSAKVGGAEGKSASVPNSSYNEFLKPDPGFEVVLRPGSLRDFLGQTQVKERLELMIAAALARGEPLGHCLFCGPPGLGKTTLAGIIAKAMGVQCVVTSGPVLERAGDLAGVLSSLKTGDVLFIDEIHRLSKTVEEYLYPAMEDFKLDLMLDSGPGARSVEIKLQRFTLVGATTRQGLLSAPLRSRFHLMMRLDYYDDDTLEKIITRSAKLLEFSLDASGAREIATRCRGTPRIANNLLKWVRDYAQIRAAGKADRATAHAALDMLDVDREGLEEMDRRLLHVLINHFSGGPVGLSTLAQALSEETHTIEEVYEPYLIMKGFLKRTPRGRCATARAYEHLNQDYPAQ